MLKSFPYRHSLIFFVLLAAGAAWQVYAGWAPLVAWVVLIASQIGIMAVLLAGKAKMEALAAATPSSHLINSGTPESLVQVVEYVNKKSDTSGQPTPHLPAGLSGVMGNRARDLISHVRAYASIEDAQSYGWAFSEDIGMFNNQPISRLATLEGQEWEYDGLMGASHTAVVPSDHRVFGRLRYKQVNQSTAASPSATTGTIQSSAPQSVASVGKDAQGLASL